MARGKWKDKFNTAAACRAQAVALRALAVGLDRPGLRANTLRLAEKWDARASACEAGEPSVAGPAG